MKDQKFNQQQRDKSGSDKSIRPDQNKVGTDISQQSQSQGKDLNKSSSSQFQNTKK